MLPQKRRRSPPRLVPNPFIKKRNLEWTLDIPAVADDAAEARPSAVQERKLVGADAPAPSPPSPREEEEEENQRRRQRHEKPATTGSPPALSPRQPKQLQQQQQLSTAAAPCRLGPSSAATEAGEAQIPDHLAHFTALLSRSVVASPRPPSLPLLLLSLQAYASLYASALHNPRGAHFVIHQHDHPVAGPHYDLRLQINGTSSASWAIMYGLPGVVVVGEPDQPPRSSAAAGGAGGARARVKVNRNATETRVHSLWNHLVETASAATGSLLIWDTGTYRVLRRRSKHDPAVDPDSDRDGDDDDDDDNHNDLREEEDDDDGGGADTMTEQEQLHRAFAARKIRLRLDGARLPRPYVVNLRLTKGEDAAGRVRAARAASGGAHVPKRRRRGRGQGRDTKPAETSSSSGDDANGDDDDGDGGDGDGHQKQQQQTSSAMERELRELEDADVRRTNAYPGAENTIGSVHQRRWYLSLDRAGCGFVGRRGAGGKMIWAEGGRVDREEEKGEGEEQEQEEEKKRAISRRREGGGDRGRQETSLAAGARRGSEGHPPAADRGGGADTGGTRLRYPFYVRGPQFERSIVTGRLGEDILRDEGVVGFVGRKGWRPVLGD